MTETTLTVDTAALRSDVNQGQLLCSESVTFLLPSSLRATFIHIFSHTAEMDTCQSVTIVNESVLLFPSRDICRTPNCTTFLKLLRTIVYLIHEKYQ